MKTTTMRVDVVEWGKGESAIRLIRETVFVREQGVPRELEWDGLDPTCWHVLAWNDRGDPIGTGRLRQEGKQARLGRMAVLTEHRMQGVGRALLRALLGLAQARGMTRAYLAAQVSAIGFYEKQGFQVAGEMFDDAGIPHRAMTLGLPPAPGERR